MIIFLIFYLNLFINIQIQPQQLEIQEAVSKSDLVGLVRYSERDSYDTPIIMIEQSFKGDVKHLGILDLNVEMDNNTTYLLFTKKTGHRATELVLPLLKLDEVPAWTLEYLNQLECFDQSLFEKHKNSICTRDLDPFCGCDGNTYGNFCEMRKAGITRFTFGECDDR